MSAEIIRPVFGRKSGGTTQKTAEARPGEVSRTFTGAELRTLHSIFEEAKRVSALTRCELDTEGEMARFQMFGANKHVPVLVILKRVVGDTENYAMHNGDLDSLRNNMTFGALMSRVHEWLVNLPKLEGPGF